MNVEDLQRLPHKGCDPENWSKVHLNLRVLAYEMVDYCESRNLPVVITSIIRPMIPGVSKTGIHSAGRAADISVKGWLVDQCLAFEKWMNDNFAEKFGAISISDGKPRACVFHNAVDAKGKEYGWHMHIQCRN